MLSIGKLGAGKAAYYLASVADGVEDYYTGAGDAPGRWLAGARQEPGGGFVAAAFRHRTSRAGDPHLHTHVLVANLARGPDGRWSALHAALLFRNAKTIGALYEAHLRMELTRRLGVEWTTPRNCIADIDGIPKQVLRAFSRRRQEIEAHLDAHGAHSPKAAEVAALATRAVKAYGTTPDALLPQWRERAAHLGVADNVISGLLGRFRDRRTPTPGILSGALAQPP